MEFTLFHKGRHTEADIDRRVDERKETKNQVATTFYMHIYIYNIYIYIIFFCALGTLTSLSVRED
jgi:hypothetical protein